MNVEPGAWMVICCYKKASFLFGKRGDWVHKPGCWNFFGGHINPGESPHAAVLRELEEETGLTPKCHDIHTVGGSDCGRLGYANGLREFHYFVLFTDHELVPQLGSEHSDYRWFKPDDLPQDVNRPTAVAIEIGIIEKALMLAEQIFPIQA
jgi:8-oxo-dGTP pyrophosphatase MutT (NUDIX family)